MTIYFCIFDEKGIKKRTSKRVIFSEKKALEFLARKTRSLRAKSITRTTITYVGNAIVNYLQPLLKLR